MKYEFSLKNKGLEHIVFALTLDKKRMTERIIIGESEQVKLQFEQGNGKVYYDKIRPLGSMLIYFETDNKKEWTENIIKFKQAYGVLIFNRGRMKIIKPQIDFLKSKADSDEPIAIFSAIHTWYEFWTCYELNHAPKIFNEKADTLYSPFYREKNLWETDNKISPDSSADSQVELWYPAQKRPFECVVGFSSFVPLISYYLHKIDEWKRVFQKCKVCNKIFLTRSRHYELCSDKCRKVKNTTAKREYDERTKDDFPEKCYDSAYNYWYNQKRKLKRDNTATQDKIIVFNNAFTTFRKEAIKQKSEVRQDKKKTADFTAFLEKQKDIADKLIK